MPARKPRWHDQESGVRASAEFIYDLWCCTAGRLALGLGLCGPVQRCGVIGIVKLTELLPLERMPCHQ